VRLAAAAAAVTLSACATSVLLPADSGATLDPIAFFTGRSHGDGTLDKVLGGSARVRVDSVGLRVGETLVLDQMIREHRKPARVRRWTMRPAGPNRYAGSLTDAVGPVRVRTAGPRAYISYTMKDGLQVEQQLALQSNRSTVLNRLSVKKFGLPLATLEETIRRLD